MLAKPSSEEPGSAETQSTGRVPLFKRRRIEEEKKKKADSEEGVKDLIKDLIDSLGVPASLSDETKKELITPEHFMVMACTAISRHYAPFRDLFRDVGGLTVCCSILTDSLLALSLDSKGCTTQIVPMWRLVRDLTLIESLTHMNQSNQSKVLEEHPDIVKSLIELVHRLTGALKWLLKNSKDSAETLEEQQRRLESCRLSALKTLVNLTNHNPVGCKQFGEAEGIQTLLDLIHSSSGKSGPEDHDCITLGLGILINSTENNSYNIMTLSAACILGVGDALEFLASIFLGKLQEENGRIAFDKMPVEHLVIAAYTSVLLGCVLKDRGDLLDRVEQALQGKTLRALGQVLEYFIVCHEEAGRGRGSQAELDSLGEILDVIQKLVRSKAK